MSELHEFLTGEQRDSGYHYTTISASLCKSGMELLQMGASPDSIPDRWEQGSWLSSNARALLPFYEPMRRVVMATRRAAGQAELREGFGRETDDADGSADDDADSIAVELEEAEAVVTGEMQMET